MDNDLPLEGMSTPLASGIDFPIGRLEYVDDDSIIGWAWDPSTPTEPVVVGVYVDGELLATALADRSRPDLMEVGIGNGEHAFLFRGLRGLLSNARQTISIRRQMDGAELDGSPTIYQRETAGLDMSAREFLAAAVSAGLQAEQSIAAADELLPFLLELVGRVANHRAAALAYTQLSDTADLNYILNQANFSEWMAALASRARSEYPPIHIAEVESPEVSIIIPVYNQFALTYACLKSIAETLPETSFEVIISDDCSSDETLLAAALLTGAIRIIRHPKNIGFIRSCNAAAATARGRYLLFLNNDTLVRPGWMDTLVETFTNVPNVGIVGSKLLFEDGKLQEAGGIIWRMGDGWNWGRGSDPRDPKYCYLRDADWVSGAALMIQTPLFRDLGGFDELYVPAYYEDTDLAFRVRARGLRTVVQPASEIIHLEGKTSGTDERGTGVKRYQLVNHKKFYKRWKDILVHHRMNDDSPELEAERIVKRRVLFIDDSVPTPDQDAGSNAALQHMIALQALGYKVTFLPGDNMAQIDPYTQNLQKLGIECLYSPWFWSVEEVFRKTRIAPDLIYLHRFTNASNYLQMARKRFPKARIIYSVADLHFLREQREAELKNIPELWKAAEAKRVLEIGMMQAADCTIVHSSFEAGVLAELAPNVLIQVVPWTVRPQPVVTPFEDRHGFLFVGGYRHPPNVDAAKFLADDVMPLIRQRERHVTAYLVGSHMPAEIKALECEDLRAIGYVPEMAVIYGRVRCSIVPLRYGAGIKGKVLDSLAHGIPCVMTPVAAEGLELPEGLQWLVAKDAQELAIKTLKLLRNAAFNREIAEAGLSFIKSRFSFEAVVSLIQKAAQL